MDFVHLHSHFWGSYSDSVLSIPEGLDRAAELGQASMAVTDHGELAFAPAFHKACREQGMNPLLGCECYFVPDARKSIERDDEFRHHLILIARNDRGYRNLVRLMSDAWLDNCFRGTRGLVDWALLEKYHEGLICLSGCYYGSFPLKLIREGEKAGEAELRRYLDIFGKDFHPEMSRLGFEEQEISNAAILSLAPRYGLRPVATNDVHYPYPEDWIAHDIIAKSRFGKVSDFSVVTRSIWLKSAAEMEALGFEPAHLRETAEVARKCDVRLPEPFVSPPVLHGSPAADLAALKSICAQHIRAEIRPGRRGAWMQALQRELALIGRMRLAGYMLAAASVRSCFRRSAKRVRALEGRGAGSAVAFALGLSDERPRLNRPPDASQFTDIALACPNRGNAIRHLIRLLGEERICRAAETVPIRGADALRFAAEVLGIPVSERMRGLRELRPDQTIEENLAGSLALRSLCRAHPEVLRWGRRIEGVPRLSHPSERALVITNGPLREIVPLKRHGKTVMAQYDEEGARLAGLLTLILI